MGEEPKGVTARQVHYALQVALAHAVFDQQLMNTPVVKSTGHKLTHGYMSTCLSCKPYLQQALRPHKVLRIKQSSAATAFALQHAWKDQIGLYVRVVCA